MSRNKQYKQSNSGAYLSFLDIVSGAFASTFFLFIIFASMPVIEGGRERATSRFIDLLVVYKSKHHLLELVIFNPKDSNKTHRIAKYSKNFKIEPITGKLIFDEKDYLKYLWKEAYITGVSASGENYLENNESDKILHLRVIEPCGGKWYFGLNVNNYSHINEGNSRAIIYSSRIITQNESFESKENSYINNNTFLENLLGGEKKFHKIKWNKSNEFIEIPVRDEKFKHCI